MHCVLGKWNNVSKCCASKSISISFYTLRYSCHCLYMYIWNRVWNSEYLQAWKIEHCIVEYLFHDSIELTRCCSVESAASSCGNADYLNHQVQMECNQSSVGFKSFYYSLCSYHILPLSTNTKKVICLWWSRIAVALFAGLVILLHGCTLLWQANSCIWSKFCCK